MLHYPVNEIFYSIQGEGFHTGRAATFVRLRGCNYQCPWCDTECLKADTLTAEQIREQVVQVQNPPTWVVITGGEPTIWDITGLLREIKSLKVPVALETNGSNPWWISRYLEQELVDWVTVSPKPRVYAKLQEIGIEQCVKDSIQMASEVKVVLDGIINPHEFVPFIGDKIENGCAFIQPCSGKIEAALAFVQKCPQWRLSVQIHKIIGAR